MNPAAMGAAAGGFAPSGKAGEYAKAITLLAIVTLVIVVIVMIIKKFGSGLDSILEALHLKDSPETVAAKAQLAGAIATSTSGANNAWSPTFHESAPDGTAMFTGAKAKSICAQIWDSVGSFWDDPESGESAIKTCQNKAQVSWLVDMFNQQYQRDLLGWLQIKYDTQQQIQILGEIVTYVSNLPNYSN